METRERYNHGPRWAARIGRVSACAIAVLAVAMIVTLIAACVWSTVALVASVAGML